MYGVGGVGKSYVAKHAAKYLFERHNFDHGCVYIELKNKYAVGENLSSLICHNLGIPTADKTTLCRYINKSKLLVILDKSSKIDALDPNMLNNTLEFYIDNTEIPKFMILTEFKTDITIAGKAQYEIDELEPRDAARLLLLCANQYIEEANKNLDVLANHRIFNLISRNPASIVRFAQFLKTFPNTLDEIVVEQEAQLQQLSKAAPKRKDSIDASFGDDCTWVIKQSYENLLKTYSDQMIILFVLCQCPNGLFFSDFEQMFGTKFSEWEEFLTTLMKVKERTNLDGSKERAPMLEEDEETFWLVAAVHCEEINQYRYLAYQIVYAYVNKNVLTNFQKQESCRMVVEQLSTLSRNLMRKMKKEEIKMLSLAKFTAAIDVGLWSDHKDFKNPSLFYTGYQNLPEDPKTIFAYHEPNIQQFLDLENLSVIFPIKGKNLYI